MFTRETIKILDEIDVSEAGREKLVLANTKRC